MEHILDHEERALARLLQQFRGKPRFEGLIAAHASRMQSCEDMLWDLLVCDSIDTATGAQLDDLGDLVGQLRGQLPDEQYRVFIRARVLVNLSSGTPDELLAIVQMIMAAMGSNAFALREDFPATFVVVVDERWTGTGVFPTAVAAILRAARAGGVRSILEWSSFWNFETFTFAPTDYSLTSQLNASAAQGATSLIVPNDVGELGDWSEGAVIHLDRDGDYGEVVRVTNATDYDQGNWILTLESGLLWGHNMFAPVDVLSYDGSRGFGLIQTGADTGLAADVTPGDEYIEVVDNSLPASGVLQIRTGTDAGDWEDLAYDSVEVGSVGYQVNLAAPVGKYHYVGDAVYPAESRTDLHAGRLAQAEE